MENNEETIPRVLVIEDNPGDARIVKEILTGTWGADFPVVWKESLEAGLQYLHEEKTDLVLLDLNLPDSRGMEGLARIHSQFPTVPVIILTGSQEKSQALDAVKRGAQDYLFKDQLLVAYGDRPLLVRSIHYALERHRLLMQVRSMSLCDELTGLNNRRGFFTLARQELEFANRSKMKPVLILADLDDMKQINDKLGHMIGDRALGEIGELFKQTFRKSDLVGRIGGDEFAILALQGQEEVSVPALMTRLQKGLDVLNEKDHNPYRLHLSLGVVRYDPDRPCSIEDLIKQADYLMYQHKREKRPSP